MKPLSYPRSLAFALLLGSLGLSGCGGALNFPDSVVSTQAAGPAVQGSVYGGHAPIVGSHVYLLQPGVTGYGSASTSLLGNNGATSASGYALTADVNDPNVPVGSEYVTTDNTGGFSFTGAYTCTVGYPVYLYSYGGTPSTTGSAPAATYSITAIDTGKTTTGTGEAQTVTYTITVSSTELLNSGENVTLSGLTGDFTVLNGAQVVLADANLTTTTFDITAGTDDGAIKKNTDYTTANFGTAGIVTAAPQSNDSIVELATLGLCPSSGNFSTPGANNGAISFIYVNEVSTVATAYTFQPFTIAANNNAWDIGSSGTTQALIGIENAASTAAQLYDIQGTTNISITDDGEGHVANYETQSITLRDGVIVYEPNEGNGVVPEATIDSLANILAACVDSAPNGANIGTGGLSAQCSKLFNTATDNGETVASGDTAPTDTATAAINIARYPAGNSSGTVDATYASDLFGIPDGTVPYYPNLTVAPNDWTIAINYPETAVAGYGATNTTLGKAESIEIDSLGDPWITAQIDYDIVEWSPLGAQLNYWSSADNPTGPTDYIYGYVSIDGNNNAWTGGGSNTDVSIQEFNNNDVLINSYGSGYETAYAVIADKSGNAYFFASDAGAGDTDTYDNSEMWEYNSSGTLESGSASNTTCGTHTAAFVYNCISPTIFNAGDYVGHGAIESAAAGGDLWVTSEQSPYQIARVSTKGVAAFVFDAVQQPEFPSIDRNGNAWIATQENTSYIYKVTPTTTTPFYTSTQLTAADTGARLYNTFGSAVDGNNNVWFANRCSYNTGTCTASKTLGENSIIEINTGTTTPGTANHAISPATNYVPEAQYPATTGPPTPILDDSLNLAIDPSGNIWITNFEGHAVVELVGAAAPVVTPLSVAAGDNMLGQKP